MNPSPSALSKWLHTAASVDTFNESFGIFGELIDPQTILTSLSNEQSPEINVGDIPVPTGLKLRSETYLRAEGEEREIALELDNTSDKVVRIRWINNKGENPSTHVWHVGPSSSWHQTTYAGCLFIFSVVPEGEIDFNLIESYDGLDEMVLGAYRPKRSLPSGSPHCILVEKGVEEEMGEYFILESLLLDNSKYDKLTVSAAALDARLAFDNRTRCQHTLDFLQTIVSNIVKYPKDEKYRKLRLKNKKINNSILPVWGAMEMLSNLGFGRMTLPVSNSTTEQEEEEYLILPMPPSEQSLHIFHFALHLLSLLQTRTDDNFVPDIAPVTPWQEPVLLNANGGGGGGGTRWNTSGTRFVTDEERWRRAERWSRMRASGRMRRPNPGEAPSSRGTWGR